MTTSAIMCTLSSEASSELSISVIISSLSSISFSLAYSYFSLFPFAFYCGYLSSLEMFTGVVCFFSTLLSTSLGGRVEVVAVVTFLGGGC